MADRSTISRIEFDYGSIVFRQEPSVVLVLNDIADLIFQQLLDGVSKKTIAADLQKRFADIDIGDVDSYIEDASFSFEELMADDHLAELDGPPLPDNQKWSDDRNWVFDQVIMAGSAGTRLQINCDHFDDLILNIYGPAVQERSDAEDPASRLQVMHADDRYWLNKGAAGVAGPFNRHGAFLEIQRHVLSTAHAPRRTNAILHAGAVLDEANSRSIILAGGSGSGKSSLTAAFLFRDYTFVADDTAIIDADTDDLWWLRLPLRLKEGTWQHIRPQAATAFEHWETIRERNGREVWRLYPKRSAAENRRLAPPCSTILFPVYDAQSSTEISRIDPLAAMALMIESGAWFETSEAAMAGIVEWLSGIPCYSVIFSSADDVVTAVNDLIRTDAALAV